MVFKGYMLYLLVMFHGDSDAVCMLGSCYAQASSALRCVLHNTEVQLARLPLYDSSANCYYTASAMVQLLL
jgi:hypothetical protein